MKKLLILLPLILLTGCSVNDPAYSNVRLLDENSIAYGVEQDGNNPIVITKLITDNGTVYGIPRSDGSPLITVKTELYNIAEGVVPSKTAWSKNGYNPNIGTVEEDVWSNSTAYVFPAVPMQMEILSSNAADTVNGTGVRTMCLCYLDGNYVQKNETVTMNGTTAVLTVATDIYRVNYFRALTTGTNYKSVGNITLRGVGGGATYNYMLAGYTRARNIIYTVPAGKTLYIDYIFFSCADATKGVRFIDKATYDPISENNLTAGLFFMPFEDMILYNNAFQAELILPTRLPEKTDLKVSVISGQAGAQGSVTLKGRLEDN